MPHRAPAEILHAAQQPVTALCLDGNSILAATVSIASDGVPVVQKLRTLEFDFLVEKISRRAHPIFMDVDYIEFPDKERLESALRELTSDPDFQHPIVGTIPAEFVRDWREAGSTEAVSKRLARGFNSFQSANPYSYPQLLGFHAPSPSQTWIWKAQLNDVLTVGSPLRAISKPFHGLVTGKRAMGEILRLLLERDPQPTTIIDVGKLRSLYIGGTGQNVLFSHAIPVGLLRDDIHYFTSLPWRMDRLSELKNELGGLFFPPDITPSPLFDPHLSTPKLDCTRFSTQIARYAHRVVSDVWTDETDPESVRYYLTGRAARLPGLREYLQFKASLKLDLLTGGEPPILRLEDGLTWTDVSDHLLPIGAGIAFHRRRESRFGLVLRDQRPLPVTISDIESGGADPSQLYVIERPASTRRRNFA